MPTCILSNQHKSWVLGMPTYILVPVQSSARNANLHLTASPKQCWGCQLTSQCQSKAVLGMPTCILVSVVIGAKDANFDLMPVLSTSKDVSFICKYWIELFVTIVFMDDDSDYGWEGSTVGMISVNNYIQSITYRLQTPIHVHACSHTTPCWRKEEPLKIPSSRSTFPLIMRRPGVPKRKT